MPSCQVLCYFQGVYFIPDIKYENEVSVLILFLNLPKRLQFPAYFQIRELAVKLALGSGPMRSYVCSSPLLFPFFSNFLSSPALWFWMDPWQNAAASDIACVEIPLGWIRRFGMLQFGWTGLVTNHLHVLGWSSKYGWWKKSCSSWDIWNPVYILGFVFFGDVRTMGIHHH